jgi:hypothetical protein
VADDKNLCVRVVNLVLSRGRKSMNEQFVLLIFIPLSLSSMISIRDNQRMRRTALMQSIHTKI